MTKLSMPWPPDFVERLAEIVKPHSVNSVLEQLATDRRPCFRVNRLKASPEQVRCALQQLGIDADPWPHKPDALFVSSAQRHAVLESTMYREGLLYSQSLSSQLAASCLPVHAGMHVLDMCAAPGGKTLQLAAMMHGEGTIVANEAVRKRFFKLRGVLAQQGADMVQTTLQDGRWLWRRYAETFDAVLVDAPCSTEARMRPGKPSTQSHWSMRKIRETSRKQKGLLRSAIRCLKTGGYLVYATCSFAPEENELIVQDAIRHFGDAIMTEPIRIEGLPIMSGLSYWRGKPLAEQVRSAVRILPGPYSEAMFICLLRKCSPTP